MLTAPNLPSTMRAAQGKDYGDIDEMISVNESVAVPRLADLPEKERKDKMIVKTLSVALACGDCRVLSGLTRELQGPPSMPYVPGGDLCGIVVELPEDANVPFTIGDRVAVRFADGPRGALGEYALVSTKVADKVPDSITSDQAAALASASPAPLIADRVQPGERVLVMGARGGVGSILCQSVRQRNPSFVAGVSKDPQALLDPPIACDAAIDYTQEDVFQSEKFRATPFDVIIDLAGFGYDNLEKCVAKGQPLIIKTASQGGRFITPLPPAGPIFEAHSWWAIAQMFLFPTIWKAIKSRTWTRSKLPVYTYAMALPGTRDCVTRILTEVVEGKIKPVIDPKGPFPFTTEGVRAAFRLQESRHAKGKVVVHVADD